MFTPGAADAAVPVRLSQEESADRWKREDQARYADIHQTLMSTISSQQGESIPGIAHAVTIEYMP